MKKSKPSGDGEPDKDRFIMSERLAMLAQRFIDPRFRPHERAWLGEGEVLGQPAGGHVALAQQFEDTGGDRDRRAP